MIFENKFIPALYKLRSRLRLAPKWSLAHSHIER